MGGGIGKRRDSLHPTLLCNSAIAQHSHRLADCLNQRQRRARIGGVPAGWSEKRRDACWLLDAAVPHDRSRHGRDAARRAKHANAGGVDPRLKRNDRFGVAQVIVDIDHIETDFDRRLDERRGSGMKRTSRIDYDVARLAAPIESSVGSFASTRSSAPAPREAVCATMPNCRSCSTIVRPNNPNPPSTMTRFTCGSVRPSSRQASGRPSTRPKRETAETRRPSSAPCPECCSQLRQRSCRCRRAM